ncbi:AMP-binding protein [Alteromonas sp. C1M14]|uniref:AMP-binding protein n=1 Tax=Alteromonas sp. C1M14 TaxID=2841567 RepID=UPI001C08DAC0|nr:AMP-binding protein [Alteromonas sp. C1M14]MBU2977389.1 AMP-binding protein [Alteromonas sp. C1M14]
MLMWLNTHTHDNTLAITTSESSLTYGELKIAVSTLARWLEAQPVRRLAIAFDNSPEWIMCDLACQQANICCVPIPTFFSQAQKQHILKESQCDYLLTSPINAANVSNTEYRPTPYDNIVAIALQPTLAVQIPKGTHKITFTSGSTGTPKGVCLSTQSQWQVAKGINETITPEAKIHLSVLPFSTLLENIAGIYVPLLRGGTIHLPTLKELGFEGSRLLHPPLLLDCIKSSCAHSLILVPDLLMVLLHACQTGWQPPASLLFIAVGGAHVAPSLLLQAHHFGLPVYEGYGLSEAVSVSTLNTPDNNLQGSAGKAIGHNQLRIEEGEIVITGNHFLGYLNEPDSFYPTELKTGDLGVIKNDVLWLHGRKKNIMVNSFGRNVSPEWVESALLAIGSFHQVLVYCEAQPYCVALICPRTSSMTTEEIRTAIARVNTGLPDYAHIQGFTVIPPCTAQNGLLTETGKIKRSHTLSFYHAQIAALYAKEYSVDGESR